MITRYKLLLDCSGRWTYESNAIPSAILTKSYRSTTINWSLFGRGCNWYGGNRIYSIECLSLRVVTRRYMVTDRAVNCQALPTLFYSSFISKAHTYVIYYIIRFSYSPTVECEYTTSVWENINGWVLSLLFLIRAGL